MAKSHPASRRKSRPSGVPSRPPQDPSTSPQGTPSSGKNSKSAIGTVLLVIGAVLLWWKLSPPGEFGKFSFSLKSIVPAGTTAPSGPAPNTDQPLDFEFDGVKTTHGFTGWGGVPKKDMAIMSGPLSMKGKTYKSGIGTQAPSEIVFGLKGKVKSFSCLAGVDVMGGSKASLSLIVKADGKILFRSKVMTVESNPAAIRVDVTGAQELSLIVDPNGDPNWDQVDWVNLMFEKSGS